uniref:Mitochondrial fission regulator n=1 Tax=Coturnix japonica TaxID=93934 RepID=A0A8C2Y9L6_COTJA
MALLLHLVRSLLEYLGWPPEQVRAGRGWGAKEYGSTRSVVRRLGTILSLEPYPRPYFQVSDLWLYISFNSPSLADVLWVACDEGQAFARFRTELWRKEKNTAYCDLHPSTDSIPSVSKTTSQKGSLVHQAALQKISALEEELTFLRTQIATIVAAQTLGSIPSRKPFCFFSWLRSLLYYGSYPVPTMTSTPLSVSHNHFAIPSPPPLPSVAPSGVDASNSAIELIKQRRAARNSTSTTSDSADPQMKNVPSMMDVLKDLNKVQLRATERSPGGTPVSKPKKRRSSDWDPVALLTHALKQKFAHKYEEEDDSLDKENRSFDSSPFSSPEIPLVCFAHLSMVQPSSHYHCYHKPLNHIS